MGITPMGLPLAALANAEPTVMRDLLESMATQAVEAHHQAQANTQQGGEAVFDAYRHEISNGRLQ